jgi:hypothetical protein
MEKGHAKIVEALFRLIAFLQTLDPTKYNPPNPNLTIVSLQTLHAQAVQVLAAVSGAKEDWRTKAKDRALDIDELPALAVSAVALFASLGVDKERVDQARTYLRKIRGQRAEPAVKDDPNTPEDESEKNISAAQTSAAQIIAHFRALIDFLTAQTEYQGLVKDAGLQAANLVGVADTVEAKHNLSVTAAAQVSSERMERDKVLYNNANSACNRAALIKEYVKGKYGASSVEYKTVNSISFEKP